jgi:hypothetical protein
MCLEGWVLIVQVVVAIILLVTAIIAGISARASRKAADATGKSAESTREMTRMQTFAQLLDAYSSRDMLKDMITLIRWKNQYPENWAERYGQMIPDYGQDVLPIHEARRHYAHHFFKIKLMYQAGYLDENRLDDLATNDQIKFLLETIEPLEKNLNPNYNDSTCRFFENRRNKDR